MLVGLSSVEIRSENIGKGAFRSVSLSVDKGSITECAFPRGLFADCLARFDGIGGDIYWSFQSEDGCGRCGSDITAPMCL